MPTAINNTLCSESLRDFISHRPGFLIRWGIPIFFFVLTSLAIGSYFIQYPDVVQASAKVHSINAPKQVVTKSGGRLVKLFTTDNKTVTSNEVIGYIESTAKHEEVIAIAALLDTLEYYADNNHVEEIPFYWNRAHRSFINLGELQPAHQSFMQSFIGFKDYLSSGFYLAKKQMLVKDLQNTRRMLQTLQQQKNLQQQDLAITQQNYNVHDTLHKEALITELEYRGQQSQLVNKKMSIPQINASIIGNETQQNALQKEMLELDNQISQQRVGFIQVLSTYKAAVESWKQKYLLTSPISGTLVYAGFLEENQQLQQGQVVAYIVNDSNSYYVEMLIPQTNFGKVKPGQVVLLKFPSYPAQDFGIVKGRIAEIKNIPSDSGYLSKVLLPQGLITTYKKQLLFTEGLMAQANIITANKRLSERFVGGLRPLTP
jgi:multidrug efflux pump subunit AcrA (membrane-fusion protein)